MNFLDFFCTPSRRKAKKPAPNRQQRFRSLRVEPLEQRALLTVIPVTPVTGTVTVANLAMAGGAAIPVANAQVDIYVGSDPSPFRCFTNSSGYFIRGVTDEMQGAPITIDLSSQSYEATTAAGTQTSWAVYQYTTHQLGVYTWQQSADPQTNAPYTLQWSGNNFNITMNAAVNATLAITSATEFGRTVTVDTAAANGFSVGNQVTIAGVGVGLYNGAYRITSIVNSTSFTYTDYNTGLAASTGGTAVSSSSNSPAQLAAQGFAVFSIAGDYEEYARTTLAAALPAKIEINYPNGTDPRQRPRPENNPPPPRPVGPLARGDALTVSSKGYQS